MSKIKVLIVDKNTLKDNPFLEKVFNDKECFEIIGTIGDNDSINKLYNAPIIDAISNKNPSDNLSVIVTDILHELGIPAHVLGYKYIREGIILMLNDKTMTSVTKALYPTIAKKFNTTSTRVERAIRHAIEIAWVRGNITELNIMFGYSINSHKRKATNSEFLMTIVDNIKLQYNL